MPPAPKTLDEIMAAELKQEIAGRYFGFRKLIEDDKLDLEQKVREYSFILEKRISFDLIRLYILLRQDELIHQFLELTGLNERLFFDPYLLESPTIAQRVFECQRFKGWTRRGRFVRYGLTCYENLAFHIGQYRSKVAELSKMRGDIAEEIKVFYQQNNISAILTFLRALGDEKATGAMQGGVETGLAEGLDHKLRIEPPQPIEQLLPALPALKPLEEVRRALKKLFSAAYDCQLPATIAMFAENSTPCPERDNPLGPQ